MTNQPLTISLFFTFSGEAVEEAGASNFFAIMPNNTIVTPSLKQETILPGVTRASILELAAAECGLKVEEGKVTLKDLRKASEAFCCGTGACITPVGSITVANNASPDKTDEKIEFGDGSSPGPITRKLYHILTGIQNGSNEELSSKYQQWIHTVEP